MKNTKTKIPFSLWAIPLSLLGMLSALIHWLTFHPREVQEEVVFSLPDAPMLKRGQKIKVLSWNVQFMAGKDYVFFFDVEKMDGPDERPTKESVKKTLAEVARVIRVENPDIILLQEVDDGARRTGYQDQLAELLKLLPNSYVAHASTFYWKNKFAPHPRIMGSTGMKLSIISKYKIASAWRHALPEVKTDPLTEQFAVKRAVLECRLPLAKSGEFSLMNTHLEAFTKGSDVMEKQVEFLKSLLKLRSHERVKWLIGGDFNLLPPKFKLTDLDESQRYLYNSRSEIWRLFIWFKSAFSLRDLVGRDRAKFFTHRANDPLAKGALDRTIDYIFYSRRLKLLSAEVRQQDTASISDHLPLVVEVVI